VNDGYTATQLILHKANKLKIDTVAARPPQLSADGHHRLPAMNKTQSFILYLQLLLVAFTISETLNKQNTYLERWYELSK